MCKYTYYQQYQLIAIDLSASFIALVDLNLNISGGIKYWYQYQIEKVILALI